MVLILYFSKTVTKLVNYTIVYVRKNLVPKAVPDFDAQLLNQLQNNDS